MRKKRKMAMSTNRRFMGAHVSAFKQMFLVTLEFKVLCQNMKGVFL
jgi:hypothetical protein